MALTESDLTNDVNDVDRIMEIAEFNTNPDELIHAVQDNAEAIFTWNYGKGERARLDKLYEKAKTSQWNAQTDLDWSIDPDVMRLLHVVAALHDAPHRLPVLRECGREALDRETVFE